METKTVAQATLEMAHASGSAYMLNNFLNEFKLEGSARNEQIALFLEGRADSANPEDAKHWKSIAQKVRELGEKPLTPLIAASFVE